MQFGLNNWINNGLMGGVILSAMVSLGSAPLPAHAQVSDGQVSALVEALRLAAPQTGRADDGLYSDWQIKPDNIPRWSRLCTGQALSPAEFVARPAEARSILVCVMRDVLQEEFANSGNNEALAVRRSAAWWMTGDPAQYNSATIGDYTQRVLSFYQQQRRAAAPSQAPTPQPAPAPQAPAPVTPASPPQGSVFDRYMMAGYAATDQRNYDLALLHFQRALDERPNNPYALQAIENVERYLERSQGANQPNVQ